MSRKQSEQSLEAHWKPATGKYFTATTSPSDPKNIDVFNMQDKKSYLLLTTKQHCLIFKHIMLMSCVVWYRNTHTLYPLIVQSPNWILTYKFYVYKLIWLSIAIRTTGHGYLQHTSNLTKKTSWIKITYKDIKEIEPKSGLVLSNYYFSKLHALSAPHIILRVHSSKFSTSFPLEQIL